MASPQDRLGWTPENCQWRIEGNNELAREQNESMTARVLEALEGSDSSLVLDAGCGYGRLSAQILDRYTGTRIVGVDGSQPMIEVAKGQLDPERFASVLGRMESMPFRSASFEVVLCMGVMMHVEDELGVVQELARLVKPNGRLLLTFFNRRSPLSVPHTVYRKIRGISVGFRRHTFQHLRFYRQALGDQGFKTRVIHPGSLFPGRAFPVDLSPILKSLNKLFSRLHARYGYGPLLEAWRPRDRPKGASVVDMAS